MANKPLDPRQVLTDFVAGFATHREAAAALGISGPYLSDLLNGRRDCSAKVLDLLGLMTIVVRK